MCRRNTRESLLREMKDEGERQSMTKKKLGVVNSPSVPGDLDVVRIIQVIHVVGSDKSNLSVRENVGGEVKGLRNLASVAAVHTIGLKGCPGRSTVV